MADKWGLRAGSEFSRPDRGHYEINAPQRAADALVALDAISAGMQKGDQNSTHNPTFNVYGAGHRDRTRHRSGCRDQGLS